MTRTVKRFDSFAGAKVEWQQAGPKGEVQYVPNNPARRAKKILYGDCSSVGRALGCDPGGRGFESHQSPHFYLVKYGAVSSAGRAGDS